MFGLQTKKTDSKASHAHCEAENNPKNIKLQDFFVHRFHDYLNKDNHEDQVELKEMLDIKCRYILEFEDLDVICGKP